MSQWLVLHRLVTGACCAEGAKGDLLALQLTFQLAPSCYATMLIRELTKMATGTAFHKNLTQVFLSPHVMHNPYVCCACLSTCTCLPYCLANRRISTLSIVGYLPEEQHKQKLHGIRPQYVVGCAEKCRSRVCASGHVRRLSKLVQLR